MGKIDSVQAARALAAVLVFGAHLGPQLQHDLSALVVGVDVFFVVSGFVMVYIAKSRETNPAQFLALRALRIYPMYWLVLFATTPVIQAFSSGDTYYIKSFFLWPALNPTYGNLGPYFTVGWTLIYELFFYGVFALLMAMRAARLAATLFGVMGIFYLAHFLMPQGSVGAALFGNTVLFEFAAGAMLAEIYLARKQFAIAAIAIIGSAAVLYLVKMGPGSEPETRAIFYGLPALGAVAGMLLVRHWPRQIIAAGDASYVTYLIHASVADLLWPQIGIGVILVALVVAYGIHVILERPLLTLSRRMVFMCGTWTGWQKMTRRMAARRP